MLNKYLSFKNFTLLLIPFFILSFLFIPKISSAEYNVVNNFISETGSFPRGSLIQDQDNGFLYGVTFAGGSNNGGVIFSFDPEDNIPHTVLHNFTSATGFLPRAAMVQASSGILYGTTELGGSNNGGVIFSFDPEDNESYTVLHNFANATGRFPKGSLFQASNGLLYGTTGDGGSNNGGVIFSFNLETDTYTVLHHFTNATGVNPQGSIMQASNGLLYGTTLFGGVSDRGVIFSFDPVGVSYSVFHYFASATGFNSAGSIMQASNGLLYGATGDGGSNNSGVIFSFDPEDNASYTAIYDLIAGTGIGLIDALTQASNGLLYGTVEFGGSNNSGVIFSFDPETYAYTVLHDFVAGTGVNPRGAFIQASNGILYQMTDSGGANSVGVMFSLVVPLPEIFGCTHPEALNYDENANTDDNSCEFPVPEPEPEPEPEAPASSGSVVPISFLVSSNNVFATSFGATTNQEGITTTGNAVVECPQGDNFSKETGQRCTTFSQGIQSSPSTNRFTRNLTLNIIGEDVRELQRYLNQKGFTVSQSGAGSVGNETTFFGLLTRSAVARFQAANNILPSVGFFGPLTRGFINNNF